MSCLLCNSSKLKKINKNNRFLCVSSDCRPLNIKVDTFKCIDCGLIQKKQNKNLLKNIKKTYKEYDLYRFSEKRDHLIYSSKDFNTRSKLIFNYIKSKYNLNEIGKILDYGCNKGQSLIEFSKFYPKWKLYGHDQIHIKSTKKINFLKDLSKSNHKFDLIFLSHTLEHLFNPLKDLKEIINNAKNNALIIVQVPFIEKNLYDLFVLDHLTHFNKFDLKLLAKIIGLKEIKVINNVIKHELTLICRYKNINKLEKINIGTSQQQNFRNEKEKYETKLNKLEKKISYIIKKKDKNNIFIFGTGISSNWISQELKFNFKGYVDEDPNKINKKHFNKKITHPSKLSKNNILIIALPDPIKKIINMKFKNQYSAKIINLI